MAATPHMSRKMFTVWQMILDRPNTWMSASEMASRNFTSRQISSMLGRIDDPHIIHDHSDHHLRVVKLEATPEEVRMLRRQVSMQYARVTDSIMDRVLELTEDGIGIDELCRTVGINRSQAQHILDALRPDVARSVVEGKVSYRRVTTCTRAYTSFRRR